MPEPEVPPRLTPAQLAQTVRRKYTAEHGADPYADLSDDVLVHAYTQKHPVYQGWISGAAPPATPPPVKPGAIPAPPEAPPLWTGIRNVNPLLTDTTPGSKTRLPEGFDPGMGVSRAAGGVADIYDELHRPQTHPGEPTHPRRLVQGYNDVLAGGMEAATPTLPAAALIAPVPTATGILTGTGVTEGLHYIGDKLGVDPDLNAALSGTAGLAVGGVLAHTASLWGQTKALARTIAGEKFAEGPPNRRGGRPLAAPSRAAAAAQDVELLKADFKEQDIAGFEARIQHEAFRERLARGMDPLDAVRAAVGKQPLPPPMRRLLPAQAGESGDVPPRGGQALEDVGGALEVQLENQPLGGPRVVPRPLEDRPGAGVLTSPTTPPPTAQGSLRLRSRGPKGGEKPGMQPPVRGAGDTSISKSGGGATTRGRQQRLADIVEGPTPPPHAAEDTIFQEALVRARQEGFTGSDGELWRRYQKEVDDIDVLNADMRALANDYGPRALLKAVAEAGGLGRGKKLGGDAEWFWESRTSSVSLGRQNKKTGKIGRNIVKPHSGTVGGVANVVREGGLDFDQLATSLNQDPRFAHLDANGLAAALKDAVVQIREGRTFEGEYSPRVDRPGWWWLPEDQEAAARFADRLHTHEGDPFQVGDLDQYWQDYLKIFGPGGDQGPGLFDAAEPPSMGKAARDIVERRAGPGKPMPGMTERRQTELGDLGGGPQVDQPPPNRSAANQAAIDELKARHQRLNESQPELPGTEGVRDTEQPTPEVGEAIFGLTPPPSKPVERPQPSLWDRVKNQEGVLILDVPPGDPLGLKRWLGKHEAEHGDSPWFQRAQAALEDDNPGRAWVIASHASARSIATVGIGRMSEEQRKALRGAAYAEATGRTTTGGPQGGSPSRAAGAVDIVQPPPVKPGQVGKGIRAGASTGAVLQPPPVRRPLPPNPPAKGQLQPMATDALMGRVWIKSLLENTKPSLLTLVEGNTDAAVRLGSQILEQAILGLNDKEVKQYLKLSDVEVASHARRAISEAARLLASLKHWQDKHWDEIGHLRRLASGELMRSGPGSEGPVKLPDWLMDEFRPLDESVYLAKGKRIMPGETPASATLDVIAEDGHPIDRAMAIAAISKPDPKQISKTAAAVDFSRTLLISTWRTMTRNALSQAPRYAIGMLDESLTGAFAAMAGDLPRARRQFRAAGQLGQELVPHRNPELARGFSLGRAGAGPKKLNARFAEMQAIFDYTEETLADLSPADARKTLDALLDLPDRAGDFLGYAVGGEKGAEGTTNSKFFDALIDPNFRNAVSVLSRTAEFSVRAPATDAYIRAGFRDLGIDPDTLLTAGEYERFRAWQQEGTKAITDGVAVDDVPEFMHEAADGSTVPLSFSDVDMVYQHAVGEALNLTFAGAPIKGTVPALLLDLIHRLPGKLGLTALPFPRFGLVNATRFVYDHSPAALFEVIIGRAAIGNLPHTGKRAFGRLGKGILAAKTERTILPELLAKRFHAQENIGYATKEMLATGRELKTQKKLLARAEKRQAQTALPEFPDKVAELTARVEELQGQYDAAETARTAARKDLSELEPSIKNAREKIAERHASSLPDLPEYMARMASGSLAIFGAALAVRAYAGKDTNWDEIKVQPSDGTAPYTVNVGAYQPFTSYLLPADVTFDIYQNTRWKDYQADVDAGMSHSDALWTHYEGKYTNASLRREAARAFFSLSRTVGTTKNLWDLATQEGDITGEDLEQALYGSLGQFLSRWTVNPVTDALGGVWAALDPEEAKSRMTPKTTSENRFAPLAAPLENVPGVRQLIPETLSQTSGEPMTSYSPLARTFAGLNTRQRDFAETEFQRIGMPFGSVYLRKTGDQGVDDTLAQNYSTILKQNLPRVLQLPYYRQLGTPARQRDFLAKQVLPKWRAAARALTKQQLGVTTVNLASEGSEARRTRIRRETLLKEQAEQDPVEASPEADPVEEPLATPPPSR